MRIGRRLLAAVLAAMLPIGVFALAGTAGAAPHGRWVVNVATTGTNALGCGSEHRPCATITYALGIVRVGGTIEVGPGTFAEQLVITSPVKISGEGASTVIDPSTVSTADTDTNSSTPQFAVVDINSPSGRVELSDLTVNGAGASATFDSCANDYVGVYFHASSGALDNVNVENVELPAADFGCQDGQGVYVNGTGAPVAVSIEHSSVTAYDKNGISCSNVGVYCSIDDSTVTGIGPTPAIAQNGIQIWSASADIENNTVSQNSYTDPGFNLMTAPGDYTEAIGVLVINAGTLTVSSNTVTANDDNVYLLEDTNPASGLTLSSTPPEGLWQVTGNNLAGAVNNSTVPNGAGIGDGLDIDSATAKVLATGNTVSSEPEFGLAVIGASGVDAFGNNSVASPTEVSYFVAGPGTAGNKSTGDLFVGNRASNGFFGFFVDATPVQETSGLTFIANSAFGASADDVADQSVGTGTLGTADQWSGTACLTSTPAGICTSHRVGHFPHSHEFGQFERGFGSFSRDHDHDHS